jgi:predicted transcriptional regulator
MLDGVAARCQERWKLKPADPRSSDRIIEAAEPRMSINANPKIVRSPEGSVTRGGIYCLFDNKKRVFLSRYVEAIYGMTPEQYRAYCGLPEDYPMTAEDYVEEYRRVANGEPRKRPRLRLVRDESEMTTSTKKPASTPSITRDSRGSVSRELIYCLFDGKGFAFPAKHVRDVYGMDWEEYIAYCGLPPFYPSIAPYYSGSDRFLDF